MYKSFRKWWPKYYNRVVATSVETQHKPKKDRQSLAVQSFYQLQTTTATKGYITAYLFIDGLVMHTFKLIQPHILYPIPSLHQQTYRGILPLKLPELHDIISLQKYIPSTYHSFYQQFCKVLPTQKRYSKK